MGKIRLYGRWRNFPLAKFRGVGSVVQVLELGEIIPTQPPPPVPIRRALRFQAALPPYRQVVELQDAVDSRARELAETKRQHQDTTTRLQNLQERLKESPKATETPSPVRHSVVDVKPPRPDLTPKSSAASPIARVLKFRDAKSGLLVAGVLCLCTFSYFFSAGGDQEQLVQRNLQLGQVNFRQREELDSCHKSVNILTERLAKCSAGPKPSAGEEADK